MDLDSKISFSKTEKLEFLLDKLREKRVVGDAAARPLSWREVDYDSWRLVLLSIHPFVLPHLFSTLFLSRESRLLVEHLLTLLLIEGMAIMQSTLGQKEEEENLCRELAAGSEEKDSVKAQHYLSFVLEERGYYAEAEKIALSLKPRIDKELGEDSPQAIGCRKIIARAVWKQGRRVEARELIKEVFALIERMGEGEGKYVVYQVGNKIMLEGMVEELEEWITDG